MSSPRKRESPSKEELSEKKIKESEETENLEAAPAVQVQVPEDAPAAVPEVASEVAPEVKPEEAKQE